MISGEPYTPCRYVFDSGREAYAERMRLAREGFAVTAIVAHRNGTFSFKASTAPREG